MDLRALETTHGDFYVPAFKVTVGGQDLVRELFLTVTRADIDLQQKAAGRFTFTVANAFDWEERAFVAGRGEDQVDLIERFAFGSPVEMFFGYGDVTKLEVPLLRGIVTEIGTSFSDGAIPELTVSGYDDLYPLTVGTEPCHWESVRDSDVVSQLVPPGLSTEIHRTGCTKPRVEKGQETDMAFLEKLAKRNQATFYIRQGRGASEFYFGPRNNERTAALELPWGKGLLTFSPEVNLARQVQRVEVHGWSAERGEPIVGSAGSGDETGRDSGRESGAQRVASALNTQPTIRVRAPVHNECEAQERARAILEERAQEFLKGEGESIGLPEIVPDINIALRDLGDPFDKTYYIKAAKHKADGSGYRTSFSVEETTV